MVKHGAVTHPWSSHLCSWLKKDFTNFGKILTHLL